MRRITIILTLFLTLSATALVAQGTVKRKTPEYAFANFERNKILYPGDSLAMERFFEKLDTLLFMGQGNVSIMHIGGSHVQAGVFSQQMRDNFLNLCPGITAGRGLVFPFMKTNTPASFSIARTGEWEYCRNAVPFDTRLGLAGASVTTSDPEASFTIVTREKNPRDITPEFDFNLVKILGYGDNDSIAPVVHYDNRIIKGRFDKNEGSYTSVSPTIPTPSMWISTKCPAPSPSPEFISTTACLALPITASASTGQGWTPILAASTWNVT